MAFCSLFDVYAGLGLGSLREGDSAGLPLGECVLSLDLAAQAIGANAVFSHSAELGVNFSLFLAMARELGDNVRQDRANIRFVSVPARLMRDDKLLNSLI